MTMENEKRRSSKTGHMTKVVNRKSQLKKRKAAEELKARYLKAPWTRWAKGGSEIVLLVMVAFDGCASVVMVGFDVGTRESAWTRQRKARMSKQDIRRVLRVVCENMMAREGRV